MANKKFLYGIGIGLLSCNVFPLVKGKLFPLAVNMVKGAIATRRATKSFVQEVNEKAMAQRQERFKRTSENFKSNSLNSSDEISEDIESLKKQLENFKNKIKAV